MRNKDFLSADDDKDDNNANKHNQRKDDHDKDKQVVDKHIKKTIFFEGGVFLLLK